MHPLCNWSTNQSINQLIGWLSKTITWPARQDFDVWLYLKNNLSTDQYPIQLPAHWSINQLVAWLIFKNYLLIPKSNILALLRLKWTWLIFPISAPFQPLATQQCHVIHNNLMAFFIAKQSAWVQQHTFGILKSEPGLIFIFTWVVAEIGCKT